MQCCKEELDSCAFLVFASELLIVDAGLGCSIENWYEMNADFIQGNIGRKVKRACQPCDSIYVDLL